MKKNILTVIYLIILVGIQNAIYADNSGQIKISAIKDELQMDNVSVKLVGAGDDLMLEGVVSDPSLSKLAEEIANQYFSNVFNIITSKKSDFSFKVYAADFVKFKGSSMGSRYIDVMTQGNDNDKPWYFLLFDQKETDSYKNDISTFLKAKFLDLSEKKENNKSFYTFNDSTHEYDLNLKASNMDNGFYGVLVDFQFKNVQDFEAQEQSFKSTIYCRKGEWIVITGFAKKLSFDETKEERDIVIIIKPELLTE